MASSPSEDFIHASPLIRRRYVQIPRDQRELLDSDAAWCENLSRGSLSLVNVPPGVLEEVKSSRTRNNANPAEQPSPVRPASSHAASAPPRPGPREEPESSPASHEDNEEDIEGTSVSLEESPPCQSSPSHEAQPMKKTPSAFVDNAPSSSAAQSEGLEMQAPEALSQESRAPVNRPAVRVVTAESSQPGATPPSAQVEIIPSTFSGTGRSDGQQPPAKRQRRMEKIALSNSELEPRQVSSRRMPMATGSNQACSASTISTSASIAQAASEQSRQSGLLEAAASAPRAHPGSSYNSAATWEGRRSTMATPRRNIVQAPASSLPPPRAAQAARRRSTPNSTGQSLPPAENSPNTRTPYEEFRVAYPDYQESTSIFVSALLNVEWLKRDWALPEFLYDDFVRAFSTGYLQYISMSVITKAGRILTAVQWYNDQVKDVQYRQKVLTKDNIHDMIKAHAVEARKIRESVGGSGPAVGGAAHEEPDEDLANEAGQDEQDAQEPGEAEWGDKSSALTNSRELQIDSPGYVEVKTTAASVRGEASPLSHFDPTNVFDANGQPPVRNIGLGNQAESRLSLAIEVDDPAVELVFVKKGKAQSEAQMDGAIEEKESEAPDAEAEDDAEPERSGPEDHAMEDDMPGPRGSPEFSINSPGNDVFASIQDEQQEEVHGLYQGLVSPFETFMSQEEVQVEYFDTGVESEDDPEGPVEFDRPGTNSGSHRQLPEVTAEGVHRSGATQGVEATPSSSKSTAARQSFQEPLKTSSTHVAPEAGSVERTFLAPLPSSTDVNGNEAVDERLASPPAVQNLPASRSQVDSSGEESETFDPPANKVAVPPFRTAALAASAPRTQAQPSDEKIQAFVTPDKAPLAPPQIPARNSPAFTSDPTWRKTMARAASTAPVAARNPTGIVQKAITDHRRAVSRISNGSVSGAGRGGSPASSEITYANVPMSKKRANETKEERSRRLKEHFRKRISGKTPSSAAASKQ